MGFFDRLFGGSTSPATIDETTLRFREIDGWIDGRLGEIGGLKSGQATPVLKKIPKILAELSNKLDELERQQPPDGIPKKFVKVVRTSKPGYLKKFRKTIEALNEGASRRTDAADYIVLLKEKLDTIEKINFGEGRYLAPVFGDAMEQIQATCKRLYEQHEQLTGMMKPSEEEERLRAVRDQLAQLAETKAKRAEVNEGISLQKSSLSGEEETLEGETKALESVLKKIGGPDVKGVREDLEDAEGAVNAVQQQILNHVGRITRGLRKYAKHSAVDAQSINALLDSPVGGFLAMNDGEFAEVLSRFRGAVEENKLSLKDRDKTLGRIYDAKKTLTQSLREKHKRLSTQTADLEEKLGSVDALKKEGGIRQGIKDSEEEIEKLTRALERDRERLKKTRSDIKVLEKEIAENLTALGVKLSS